jgi:hypothetical protein
MFGPNDKAEELTRGYRLLHDEELYNLHSSPNIKVVKEDEVDGTWNVWAS